MEPLMGALQGQMLPERQSLLLRCQELSEITPSSEEVRIATGKISKTYYKTVVKKNLATCRVAIDTL